MPYKMLTSYMIESDKDRLLTMEQVAKGAVVEKVCLLINVRFASSY